MVSTVKATLVPTCPFKILLFSKAEKVSFKHDYLKALDRKKSIFDIMILFLLRTVLHQENTKQLYQKLPPALYRSTKHHPTQRIWTCIPSYQCQQQWDSQYLSSFQGFDMINVGELLLISKLTSRTTAAGKRQKIRTKVVNTICMACFYMPHLFKL